MRTAVRSPTLINRQHVTLAEEQVLFVADGNLIAGVRAEDDAIASPQRQRLALAIPGDVAVADRDDRSLLRFVLGRVGQHDPAGGFPLGFLALQDDAVVEGDDFHAVRALGVLLRHWISSSRLLVCRFAGGGSLSARPRLWTM